MSYARPRAETIRSIALMPDERGDDTAQAVDQQVALEELRSPAPA